MKQQMRLLISAFVFLWGFSGAAQALNVGVYEMCNGAGATWQQPAVVTAGHTPVILNDLTSADLAGVDVIFVTNCNNSGYDGEYLSRLADIQTAVNAGKILVIHDRHVDGAEGILPGGAAFDVRRDFLAHADINVLDNTTLVTNGPGGIVTDVTLDNGDFVQSWLYRRWFFASYGSQDFELNQCQRDSDVFLPLWCW